MQDQLPSISSGPETNISSPLLKSIFIDSGICPTRPIPLSSSIEQTSKNLESAKEYGPSIAPLSVSKENLSAEKSLTWAEYVSSCCAKVLDNLTVMDAADEYHLAKIARPSLSKRELMFVSAAKRYGYGVATRMALIYNWPFERVLDILCIPRDYIELHGKEAVNNGEDSSAVR